MSIPDKAEINAKRIYLLLLVRLIEECRKSVRPAAFIFQQSWLRTQACTSVYMQTFIIVQKCHYCVRILLVFNALVWTTSSRMLTFVWLNDWRLKLYKRVSFHKTSLKHSVRFTREDVGPVPTWYAAVHLAIRTRPLHCATLTVTLTLTFDRFKWKLAHLLYLPWGTFTPIFVILPFFVFELAASTNGWTDRQTGKTCIAAYKVNTVFKLTNSTTVAAQRMSISYRLNLLVTTKNIPGAAK